MKSLLCLFCLLFTYLCGKPDAVYLTLSEDPTRQMEVHWIDSEDSGSVFYRSEEAATWQSAEAFLQPFDKSKFNIHHLLLENLKPDTVYHFKMNSEENDYYAFRTLPLTLSRSLTVAIGGDCYQKLSTYKKMNTLVADKEPDFVIFGGDLAYAYGSWGFGSNPVSRWIVFLQEWEKACSDHNMIPFVPVVGNHDVSSKSLKNNGEGELFVQLFPPRQKGISYRVLDVCDRVSFFILDTGHICPIEGKQELWLKETLEKKKKNTLKIPVYHIAAYPSVYSFSNKISKKIRSLWSPLFERNGVRIAFEHHNHAFKRTYPMAAEKLDPKGVVYMGDGAWSISPRKARKNLFYTEKKAKSNCVSFLTISDRDITVEVLDLKGNVIDTWKPEEGSSSGE